MQTELITALDVADSAQIPAILTRLPAEMRWFKVGLELFCAEGPASLNALTSAQKRVFLDLKLHDIPRTVERAVRSATAHGSRMLTVHAAGGKSMLRAAADAAGSMGKKAPILLAVTMLTSLDQNDLRDIGVSTSPSDHVLKMAELALESGIPGLVCSPQEIRGIRARFGESPILVTPGIRLPTNETADQKRVGSPREAVRDGANFLVVGRPILEATDPRKAARAILDDMQA